MVVHRNNLSGFLPRRLLPNKKISLPLDHHGDPAWSPRDDEFTYVYLRYFRAVCSSRKVSIALRPYILFAFVSLSMFLNQSVSSKPTNKLTSISIESERAAYQRHKTPYPHLVCVHEGNVKVTLSQGAHAQADILEARIRETSGDKKNKVHDTLETITLKHNVTITHHHQTVRGEHALLNAASHTCTITGNVTITKKDEKGHVVTSNAKNATLDLTTNRVTLEGSPEKPVYTLIQIPPRTTTDQRTSHKAP